MKNIILDYEQVEEKLQEMVANSSRIRQEEDLGVTTCGLPIHHYTIGNGSKEIVVTGATHGCEIISTDFVLHLMEKLSDENGDTNIDLSKYTIHFVPMLNPEGYLISTSAIRKIIPRDMPLRAAEIICKLYYLKYREDDRDTAKKRENNEELDRNPEDLRRFQAMFSNIDYTCIPEKYSEIRESVRKILEKYPDIPKGSLQIWSANANGIDPQANSEYNNVLLKIKNGELTPEDKVYVNNLRYANINQMHPGPINCGFDPEVGFELQPEIEAISGLLSRLSEKGTLYSYFNYHSVGGLIYQRPAQAPEEMGIEENDFWTKTLDNFALSKLYAGKTYTNVNNPKKSNYKILTKKNTISTSADALRVRHPRNFLIELSGMGGNPVGPYGDIKGNYTNVMN